MNTRVSGTGQDVTAPTRRLVIALALVVLATYYPYAEATGSCGKPGCPEFSPPRVFTEFPGALVAVLAAVPALAGGVRLRPASDRKPVEIYLAPDPEPPRP